jgi:MATE family multidrug resistance protein
MVSSASAKTLERANGTVVEVGPFGNVTLIFDIHSLNELDLGLLSLTRSVAIRKVSEPTLALWAVVVVVVSCVACLACFCCRDQSALPCAERAVSHKSPPEAKPSLPAADEDGEMVIAAGSLKDATRTIAMFGLPIMYSQVVCQTEELAVTALLARHSTELLAAVSTSHIWIVLVEDTVCLGCTQLSTLCGPAFGAKNFPLVATWLQIYLIMATCLAVPLTGLRFLTAPVLEFIGISKSIAIQGAVYAIWSSPKLVLFLWHEGLNHYYSAQGIVLPKLITDCVVTIPVIVCTWFVVVHLHAGTASAGLLVAGIQGVRLCFYAGYNYIQGNHKRTWHAWSAAEVFRMDRWETLVGLMLPAGLLELLESIQLLLCAVLAARLGTAMIACYSFLERVLFFCVLFADSLGDATGIIISILMGANDASLASYVAWVGLGLSCAAGMVLGLLITSGWNAFVETVSEDPAVQAELKQLRWLLAAAIGVLGNLQYLWKVLSKQGRIIEANNCVAGGCLVVGLPISFAFRGSLKGIFIGSLTGYLIAMLGLFVLFIFSDWQQLTQRAQQDFAEVGPPAGTVSSDAKCEAAMLTS